MELAGMPNRQHGSLSARMDTKDGSKKLNMTIQCFYRYILQVSCLSRMANRGWKPGKHHRGVGCSPGTSICCWGWSARGAHTAATAGGQCWGHPEQGDRPDVPRGTDPRGSAQSGASLSRQTPCRALDASPEATSFSLGKLVGRAPANWELFVVSYCTSARRLQCAVVEARPVATGPSSCLSGASRSACQRVNMHP